MVANALKENTCSVRKAHGTNAAAHLRVGHVFTLAEGTE